MFVSGNLGDFSNHYFAGLLTRVASQKGRERLADFVWMKLAQGIPHD